MNMHVNQHGSQCNSPCMYVCIKVEYKELLPDLILLSADFCQEPGLSRGFIYSYDDMLNPGSWEKKELNNLLHAGTLQTEVMNQSILQYAPINELRGCSTRKVPPQATVKASRRVHLKLHAHSQMHFGPGYMKKNLPKHLYA